MVGAGVIYELVKVLAQKINFTYEIVQAPDNKFGNKLADGKWNGLIGMLVTSIVLISSAQHPSLEPILISNRAGEGSIGTISVSRLN